MKVELFKKKIIFVFGEYFSRYAHALRFAVGLQGTQTFHPIDIMGEYILPNFKWSASHSMF